MKKLWADRAWDDYLYWQTQDKKTLKWINELIKSAVAKELEFEPDECFGNIVTVDAEEYAEKHFDKAVKKTLTIPAWLNTAAMEQGINLHDERICE